MSDSEWLQEVAVTGEFYSRLGQRNANFRGGERAQLLFAAFLEAGAGCTQIGAATAGVAHELRHAFRKGAD